VEDAFVGRVLPTGAQNIAPPMAGLPVDTFAALFAIYLTSIFSDKTN
jgi:hypothetical protein